mmetsp:Transcript_60823/g.174397  ORF Transcript_60823/g.174397 Transcript_60823/m.174397 type:complete len:240 (-) Transcript_60823:19-738(-)
MASRSRPTPGKPKVQEKRSPFVAKDDTTYMLMASSKTPWRLHTKGNRKSFSHLRMPMSTQGSSKASGCLSPKSFGPRPIQRFGIFFTATSCRRFSAPSPLASTPSASLVMKSTCPKFLFASSKCFTKVKPPDSHGCTFATISSTASARAPAVSSACASSRPGSKASQGRQTAPAASRAAFGVAPVCSAPLKRRSRRAVSCKQQLATPPCACAAITRAMATCRQCGQPLPKNELLLHGVA